MLSRPFRTLILAIGSWMVFSTASMAEAVDPATKKKITQAIQQARGDITIGDIAASPVPGLFQVQLVNGPTVYATEDGDYFLVGDLYQVAPGKLTNVTEEHRTEQRQVALADIDKDEMIVFSPEGETKGHITVFTDVDCGYCRMLHQEVPALNEMGIEVRYMAFPRAGVNSESFRKLTTAWCADNPQETLTRLKSGESVPTKVCEGNPVEEQYLLGQQVGVTATPAIVLESGELQLGYLKAPQLAARLGL